MSAMSRRALAICFACALGVAALGLPAAAHATFPGRNGVISYSHYTDQADVWTINPDGTGAAPLIATSTYEGGGGWSADGRRITYWTIANQTGQYDLWTADADGSNPQHAVHPLDVPDDLFPALSQNASLSPDGNTIVFDNQRGIHTVPVGGGPVTTLEEGSSSSFNMNPVYSPDGTKIAYTHFFPDRPSFSARIEVLDVADPTQRTIVTDPGDGIDDTQPDWSPDGSKIAFTRFINGVSSNVYVIDLGLPPGSEQNLTPNPLRSTDSISWSPDGTKLLFRENDRLSVMDADGSNPHFLADAEPSGVTDFQPRWQTLPPIDLEMTGPASANAGDDVQFALNVTNGGTDPIENVNVTDPGCDATSPALVTKNGDATPNRLDPGDSWDYGCSAKTDANALTLHNAATAQGTLPSNAIVSDSDDADVNLVASFGPGGGTASTGSGATPDDPANSAVSTPVASSISVVEPETVDGAPSGFAFVPSQFNIDVTSGGSPVQTSVSNPLRIVFTIDASLVPAGGVDSLEVFRDGAVIAPCAAADGSANPDPCVAGRAIVSGGDATITVLSTHASHWNFGTSTRTPFAFSGFAAPIATGLNKIKPGSVVPMKFGLGGNQGLAIFAAGYPTLQPIDCTTRAATGPAVQATGGTLTYDVKAQRYTYSWKSPKSLSACSTLNLKTVDGVSHPVLFTTH